MSLNITAEQNTWAEAGTMLRRGEGHNSSAIDLITAEDSTFGTVEAGRL